LSKTLSDIEVTSQSLVCHTTPETLRKAADWIETQTRQRGKDDRPPTWIIESGFMKITFEPTFFYFLENAGKDG